MTKKTTIALASAAALFAGGWWMRTDADTPQHRVPKSPNGNLVVELCDGETSAEVPGVKDGGSLNREQAQSVSDQLMTEWRRKNPSARWDDAVQVAASKGQGEGGSAAPAEKKPAGVKAEPARQD